MSDLSFENSLHDPFLSVESSDSEREILFIFLVISPLANVEGIEMRQKVRIGKLIFYRS